MSTNRHTPYENDVTNFDATVMNVPLGELDEAITGIEAGATAIEAEISSARGGETDLDTRLDVIEAALGVAGDGDVTGPASNTDEHVPQWDGADSKTLGDGFPITAAGKALIDDADASAQRATLGLGSIATKGFWTGTGAEYTALVTHDSNTIYFLTSGV